ncbi:cellulosome anchoring protein cohesin region [Methanosphaerula palustris E1-9c]|uniref:Cellulosome anchoring protein cohesin region n=2 Tax=Methanosphaerula palustris TaxID=475088 RepID=B8GF65_METPE|nr:cellulosome anchoring protein cohesin region [Methanosphaerula palustris E1-9c]
MLTVECRKYYILNEIVPIMKFQKTIIVLIFLTLICVSTAGASGTVKFHIPEISNAAVGDTVDATLYVDNNANPLISDIALDLNWSNGVLQYEGTTFSTGSTNLAEEYGSHIVTINMGDHTKGIATGDVALAHIKFKVLTPDNSPIEIKVVNVVDLSGNDLTGTATAVNGEVKVGTQTTTPSTTAPTYSYQTGSIDSGGWQTVNLDVTSTDRYDILGLAYSTANTFEIYVYDPSTGSIITMAKTPYFTANNLNYILTYSTLKPGRYTVIIHSTSGSGNYTFFHFY